MSQKLIEITELDMKIEFKKLLILSLTLPNKFSNDNNNSNYITEENLLTLNI